MKKHSIIPIFIPHNGCPHDCVFCNQKRITARKSSPSKERIIKIIERNLGTIPREKGFTAEIAFFGGSFTGLTIEDQNNYLKLAKKYKDDKRIDKIRLSTRPDYIDENILVNLKEHGVDIIELGAQSFDDQILSLSERGHDSNDIVISSRLIHDYGFELGIQLMTGLPSDTMEKALYSADMAISLNPDMVRIYPTVVLDDTKLKEMMLSGDYVPFEREEMIRIVTEVYRKFKTAGITVIRIGLKSTDLINDDSNLIYNDYHPAFRELVEGRLALEKMEDLIRVELGKDPRIAKMNATLCFTAPKEILSFLSGHKKENRKYLEGKYPLFRFVFSGDETICQNDIKLNIEHT